MLGTVLGTGCGTKQTKTSALTELTLWLPVSYSICSITSHITVVKKWGSAVKPTDFESSFTQFLSDRGLSATLN